MQPEEYSDSSGSSISIKTKLFLVILATTSVVTLAASYLFYAQTYNAYLDGLRGELTAIARTAAQTLDGDKHHRLEISRNEKSKLYSELKNELKDIKRANKRIRYVYTMTKTKKSNTWQFVVDAEDNPDLVSHLGDPYDISDYPEMRKAFSGPIADGELNTDEWGTWLSGYAPIYDSKGNAVAILGIDMSAENVKEKMSNSQRELLVPALILLLLPAAMSWIISRSAVRSLTSMIDTAKKIASGDYDQRIFVRTNDEIGELADALNNMAENIRQRVGSAECMIMIDSLTDLCNHRYFQDRLDDEIKRAERYERELTIIVIDIDKFNDFNINNGHARGDEALKQIAEIIKRSIRGTDIAARHGGEEFAIMLPETGEDEARMIAEHISTMVSVHQFPTKYGIALPLTVGIGVACYPAHGDNGQDIMASAFRALGQAKNTGTNRIICYSDMLKANITGNVKPERNRAQTDEMVLSAVFSLARAVDARDKYTRKHSEFVARYAAALGRAIGLDEQEVTNLSIAGLLHDIGKIGIPDSVLNKPGRLTEDELMLMNRHPILGAEIIRNMRGIRTEIVRAVLHHHEKYDGTGYPDGMKSEEISLIARILTIVDSYHAMISDRPYRKGLSFAEAKAELIMCKGTQFDPQLVDAFIELFESEHNLLQDILEKVHKEDNQDRIVNIAR